MSRFTSHLDVCMLEDERGAPVLRGGRCLWLVDMPLTYDVGAEGSGESITVPAGAVTDLASIPRFAWSLGFPADGPWLKAAVIHDFLYETRGTCMREDCRSRVGRRTMTRLLPYSRAEADDILREAMAVLGVGAWERGVIWSAVRIGGSRGWGS